ncbi:MAG: SpoIIE family protein phosphatase [Verrucomicrobia bacterium]|nr:SpoIIE family protein phosphatase [Verrucomicrobiota bacterium]
MTASFPKTARAVTFELALECNLDAVRSAVVAVRQFLAEQGLPEDELTACEIALVEACNNAIQYAPVHRHGEPVEIKAICNGAKLELQVTDHTPGFDWPEAAALPDPTCERGRGLFLIQTLMQPVRYFRGGTGNTLVMRRGRTRQGYHHSTLGPEGLAQTTETAERLRDSERVITDMAKELCVRSESLSAIFRCSAELGRSNDLKEFSERLLNDLLHITSSDWFVLRLVSGSDTCLEVFAASEPFSVPLPPALHLDTPAANPGAVEWQAASQRREIRFDLEHPLAGADPLTSLGRNSSGLVCPLFLHDRLIGTLAVGRDLSDAERLSAREAEVVRTFAGFLAIQCVNAQLQEDHVNGRLIARELEIARNIQRALLPKSFPCVRGFSLCGFLQSARQVGGDLYDVLPVSDDALLLIVADVMGHGVPAAMFAAILRSLVRVLPEWTHQPSALLSKMNRMLYDDLSEVEMFITAQLAFVDIRQRVLTAASAGHCPLLLASASQPAVRTVSPEGMPLGILRNPAFTDETVPLGKGARLLLYTDGLTELRDGQGQCFGQQRLMRWLASAVARRLPADAMKTELAASLEQFQPLDPLPDDQTFLILAEDNSGS